MADQEKQDIDSMDIDELKELLREVLRRLNELENQASSADLDIRDRFPYKPSPPRNPRPDNDPPNAYDLSRRGKPRMRYAID